MTQLPSSLAAWVDNLYETAHEGDQELPGTSDLVDPDDDEVIYRLLAFLRQHAEVTEEVVLRLTKVVDGLVATGKPSEQDG